MTNIILVGLGGFLGAVLRYLCSCVISGGSRLPTSQASNSDPAREALADSLTNTQTDLALTGISSFPWSTLAVNLIGCLALALILRARNYFSLLVFWVASRLFPPSAMKRFS